jgi:hypothetical protein
MFEKLEQAKEFKPLTQFRLNDPGCQVYQLGALPFGKG